MRSVCGCMPASSAATEIMNTPWSCSNSSSRSLATSDLPPCSRDQIGARVPVHDLGEPVDRLLLLGGQGLRDLDLEAVANVAVARAGELLGALAAQALEAAVGRARRHADALGAGQGRHLDGPSAHGLDDRDRHLDLDVVAVALEH